MRKNNYDVVIRGEAAAVNAAVYQLVNTNTLPLKFRISESGPRTIQLRGISKDDFIPFLYAVRSLTHDVDYEVINVTK